MTPTNEVRAKLDELGIAWVAISERATEYTQEGILCRAYETFGGLQVAILTPVTPEQAIAATVGEDIERYDGSGRRGTVAILQGGRRPEEVLFVRDEGGVTHYKPEDAGTCYYIPDETGFTWWDKNDVEHYEEYSAGDECGSASCDKCGYTMMVGDDGWFDGWDEITEWTEEDGSHHKGYVLKPRFKHCPNCGRRIKEEAE